MKPGIFLTASLGSLVAIVAAQGPAWAQSEAEGPELTKPSDEQLTAFQNVRDDNDVREIRECKFTGTASHKCRDPLTYYKTNEGMRGLFTPYIRDLRGGYVGLASDQNYDFISMAKSEWVWLFDYDPSVVHIHQLIRAVVLRAETAQEFVTAYEEENFEKTLTWLRESLGEKSTEVDLAVETAKIFRKRLHDHYIYSARPKNYFKRFGWLSVPEHYAYIRQLYQNDRVIIRKGNLLTDVVLPDIAKSAKALDVPIRITYTSNAVDMWALTPQVRKNLSELPYDAKSLFLHTLGTRKLEDVKNELDYEGIKWLFIVHKGRLMQKQMKKGPETYLREMCSEREATRFKRLFTLGPVGKPRYAGRKPAPKPQ